MPGKVIVDHYKKIKELEESLKAEVDEIINLIDVDALIDDPKSELDYVSGEVIQLIEDEFIERAAELGVEFGKMIDSKIDRGKEIVVETGTIKQKTEDFKDG
jgi:hypothetical protein